MGLLTDAESARVAELSRRLQSLPLDVPDDLDEIALEVRALLGLDAMTTYSVEQAELGYRLSSWRGAGFAPGDHVAGERFGGYIGGVSGRWGFFDPIRPEPRQQNQPVVIPPFASSSMEAFVSDQVRRLGLERDAEATLAQGALERTGRVFEEIGVHRHHQLRVLVCERGTLLAWVGGFRDEPFDRREVSILRQLTPSLQSRFATQRTLGEAKIASAALSPVLEQVSAPAFVVTQAGNVVFANSIGRERMASAGEATRAQLRRATTGGVDGTVTRLEVRGMTAHYLVVLRGQPSSAAKLEVARVRWQLTGRQMSVLEKVVLGLSNRAISAELRVAESTVELHVTALLRKAEVESRAALVARFWSSL